MEIIGNVKRIGQTETFASGFQKRELILLTQEQYPQTIAIEFLSDKISLLDNLREGESVKIGINIRGREWTSPQGEVKYFNSITGWRLERMNQAVPEEPTQAKPAERNERTATDVENPFGEDEDDDLPF